MELTAVGIYCTRTTAFWLRIESSLLRYFQSFDFFFQDADICIGVFRDVSIGIEYENLSLPQINSI